MWEYNYSGNIKKGSKNLKKKGVSYSIDKYGHVIRTATYTH